MYHIKQILSILGLLVFLLPILADMSAEARGTRGGGFGRTSSGFGKSIGRSGWGSSRARPDSTLRSTSSSWGRSSQRVNTTTIPPSSNTKPSGWTGGNMAKRKGTQGTVYRSRSEAEAVYRENLKTQWDKEPASRPDYVPRTINVGGRNQDLVFHNGQYGYYGPNKTWIALSAANMLMSGALLAQRGFYYGTPYYATAHRGGSSKAFFVVLLIFAGVVFLGMKRFI